MHRSHRHTSSKARARRLRNAIGTFACAAALFSVNAGIAAARVPSGYSPDATSTGQGSSIVRVVAPSAGFDWGAAGIGAAAGLAMSLVAVGGALAVSRRRDDRVRPTIRPTG